METMKRYFFLTICLSLFCLIFLGAVPDSRLDPSTYPEIGDQEMGQLRWTLNIADQGLDDFANLEALDQKGMTAYRYSIAFMTYFLALEQYHKLPACPEIIRPRMDRLIQKMIEKPVWEYWAEVSQGVKMLEPKSDRPYPESHDPVRDQNIMYSGHLGHMIGLFEMLYRDFKWDQPGSIVFAWSDREKYVYDNHSLQKVMYDQMKNNAWHSIACEPNAVFPECNQHPVLSFMLYDQTHGTSLALVKDDFFDFFLSHKLIDPGTHETAAFYLVKQDVTVSQRTPFTGNAYTLALVPAVSLGLIKISSSSANGWTGSMMHAWQPEYIERQYPYQRRHHIIEMNKQDALLQTDNFEPNLQYGYFAMLAGEVGDIETRDKLLKFAEEQYKPVWQEGTYHYPFSKARRCTSLTDKLLAIARANPVKGLWAMHNKPLTDSQLASPKLAHVKFPEVLLRRAIYDDNKKALIVTTEPGTIKSGKTAFDVVNLDPGKSYTLDVDGHEAGKYSGVDQATVEIGLDQRHDLLLIADR